jgi:hypothetical protein
MRVRNLELRKCIGKNKRFEIIKWQFYEKENKEFCYVIYFVENGIIDFIGNRPLELENIQEYKDSLFLLRKSIKKSIKYQCQQSCSQAE